MSMSEVDVRAERFADDGSIPNNPDLPLLLYPGALQEHDAESDGCTALFDRNGWGGAWVDGVYSYHHYHSTAHEVLGVVGGSAWLILGGPKGIEVEVGHGDVIVIPAGVGHCNKDAGPDFSVVGAYPHGQTWDLLTGKPDERPRALENIAQVPLPRTDPVFGTDGPLVQTWLRS